MMSRCSDVLCQVGYAKVNGDEWMFTWQHNLGGGGGMHSRGASSPR